MSKIVQCAKLGKAAEGLDSAPYPGELGDRILASISKEAWALWMARQTMLINEHHLKVRDRRAREFLAGQMEAFLFEDGGEAPEGYVPPDSE